MAKILAIDDNQDNLITISALLRSFIPGTRVSTADSGPAGIEKARQEHPDTILLDLKMPGMDGFEVCKILKKDPLTSSIPIILVTAVNTDSNLRTKGLETGADAFLAKPIDQAELAAQVNAMLRIKFAEDKLRREKNQISDLYELLFNGNVNPVTVYDTECRIVMMNDAGVANIGKARENIIGHCIDEFFPDGQKLLQKRIKKTVREKKILYFEDSVVINNSTRWFWSSFHLLPGDDGTPDLIQVISTDVTKQKEAEREQLRLRRNLESLWEIAKKSSSSLKTISDTVLKEITRLTDSTYAFYGFINEEKNLFTIYSWSNDALDDCRIHNKPIEYPLKKAGIWSEAVNKRTTLLVNDYKNAVSEHKIGLPEGHVPITNFISVPVFDGDKIVALGAVANKEQPYCEEDVKQISAYMQNAQIIINRKRSEDVIKQSLKEKEVLLKEIHHRVKNNLQNISALINIKKMTITNEECIEILSETSERVYSIGLVHELLYRSENFSNIDFHEYIVKITGYLSSLYMNKNRKITIHLDTDPVKIDINGAVPLALLLNELIVNSFKYAFPEQQEGVITIVFKEKEEEYLLEITDNGIGLPEDYDKKNTFGILLINQLTKQLTGSCSFFSREGTAFQLRFPR